MDFQESETKTGFRMPFQYLPNNNNTALKLHIPLGFFYSPFFAESTSYQTTAPRCTKCQSVVHPYSVKNNNARKWTCGFCSSDNALIMNVGNYNSEEFIEAKTGENGLFFVVDLSMPEQQFAGLKSTLLKTIERLPQNIFVGLVAFSRSVYVYDFSEEALKFHCFNGHKDYNVAAINEQLGMQAKNDPRKQNSAHFYVPLALNAEKLRRCIESLEADSFPYNPDTERQERATGTALHVTMSVIEGSTICTRIALLISGPCTVGPGQIVGLALSETMRTFIDMNENNSSNRYLKAARKFYDGIEGRLSQKHTLDIWAFGLDQYGLVEMKDMTAKSGGIIAMHELFNHFIFDSSFTMHYGANEQGMFNFPVAAKVSVFMSKEMKIKGMLGYGKSLKDDKLNQASEMETGEGRTSVWYVGGCPVNTSLLFFIANSDSAKDEKDRGCIIQVVTQFKYSDNIMRTRVSTITREYFREPQLKEIIRSFDQQAAIVLLARYSSYKADVEDCQQVKKWLDRTLLKFIIRFANYQKFDVHTFRLHPTMKLFPQFEYHLRRSSIINTFNCSPDESTFNRSCLMRESIANCLVMIQPALLMYTVENPTAEPVQLDIENMKEDVVLLLDSYFVVLVWYGEHIHQWKKDKVNEQEEYAYLNELFNNPMEDSSAVIYERIPVSNFYETFKGDGKERYLKSRVNPSTSNASMTETGNFVTDDAPIKLFMDFLIKSVVNYSE